MSRSVQRRSARSRREFARLIAAEMQKAVQGWVTAGRLLIEASDQFQHGQFLKMLREDLKFRDPSKPERLMKIARNSALSNSANWPNLPDAWTTLAVLAHIPPDKLQTMLDDGRVHRDLSGSEAEALTRQFRRANNSTQRNRTFAPFVNGAMQTDLWSNRLPNLFGWSANQIRLGNAGRIFKLAKDHLRTPHEILPLTLAIATLLPDDRHRLGGNQPKKWALLLARVFEHDKTEAILQELSQLPLDQHESYINRLIASAYEAGDA